MIWVPLALWAISPASLALSLRQINAGRKFPMEMWPRDTLLSASTFVALEKIVTNPSGRPETSKKLNLVAALPQSLSRHETAALEWPAFHLRATHSSHANDFPSV